MKKMWLIGLNTFRESLRKKTIYFILIFALIVIGASKLFSFLTAEEELKMIKDVSFSSIEFFGALMAIFGSLYAISTEIERRTIYTLLTKPIRRSDFVIGKFFGVSMILFINFILMTVFFLGLLFFKKSPPDIQVFKTLLLIFFELILIASITLALGTFTSDAFNIICSFFLYIVGHLTSYGKELIERTENIVVKGLTEMLYTLVPNYENFNIRDKIVVGLDVSWGYVGYTILYGILYLCIALYIALYFFEKREV